MKRFISNFLKGVFSNIFVGEHATMRIAILSALVVVSSVIHGIYGYTIPLAKGNHWVYGYSFHDSSAPVIALGYLPKNIYDTTRTGLFKISIDSLINKNDSVFFSITTVDSGKVVSKTIDSASQVTTDSFGYYQSLGNHYLFANDSNFIYDSLGAWVSAGWEFPRLGYAITLNSSPWLLNYPGPTNSSFYSTHQNNTGYTEYQQHSDSIYPTVINGNNYLCYTTGIIDSEMNTNGPARGFPSTIMNSKYSWIQNIGYGSCVDNIIKGWFGISPVIVQHISANWTLLSFNDNPVTLPSKVIRSNPKQTVKSNKPNPYRKAFLLEGSHQPLNSSASIFNIRGQQLGKIQRAQIIIIKDR